MTGEGKGRWFAIGSWVTIAGAILLLTLIVCFGLWWGYLLFSGPQSTKLGPGDALVPILLFMLALIVVGTISMIVLAVGGSLGLVFGVLGIVRSTRGQKRDVPNCSTSGILTAVPATSLAVPQTTQAPRRRNWWFGLAVAGTTLGVIMLLCSGFLYWVLSPIFRDVRFASVHMDTRPVGQIRAEMLQKTPLGRTFDQVRTYVQQEQQEGRFAAGLISYLPPDQSPLLEGSITVNEYGGRLPDRRTTGINWRFNKKGELEEIEVYRY